MPVTIPEVPTVPIPGFVLVHVPPGTASLRDVTADVHTVSVPDIADGTAGSELTVTTFVAAILPQLFVSV